MINGVEDHFLNYIWPFLKGLCLGSTEHLYKTPTNRTQGQELQLLFSSTSCAFETSNYDIENSRIEKIRATGHPLQPCENSTHNFI